MPKNSHIQTYTYIHKLVLISLKRDLTYYSVSVGNEIRSKSMRFFMCSPSTHFTAASITFFPSNYRSQNEKKNIFTVLSSCPYSRNAIENTSTARVSFIRGTQYELNSSVRKQDEKLLRHLSLFRMNLYLSNPVLNRSLLYLYS
jgi:hypothetical protein